MNIHIRIFILIQSLVNKQLQKISINYHTTKSHQNVIVYFIN